MANLRNEFEFRSGLLDALGVEHTEADAKNEERWRSKMLDGLGVEYNQNDVNQFDLFRIKLLEGVENYSGGGGGGSSDFSTAKMTVINNKEWTIQVNDCPVALVEDEMLFGGFSVNANRQSVFDVIIYKGYAHIIEMVTGVSIDTPVDLETEASLSGNAEYDAEDELIAITGDCTITIS